MNSKLVLVLVALVGIGLYGLPSTMALFANQHSFINIDPSGNQIACTKCHGDVQAELTGAGNNSQSGTPSPHANMKCEFCHRLAIGQASGDNAYGLITYNDAIVYPNGSVSKATEVRYAIVNPGDYEAGAYPKYLNDTDVVSGLAGSHGHSVQLNPYNKTTGTNICSYPECGTDAPTLAALLTATGVPFGVDVSGRNPATPGAMSLSPTFTSAGVYIPAPSGKVLNSNGTMLCGGQLANASDPTKGFVNQMPCVGGGGTINALVNTTGVPLDTNPATQFTGFLAGQVTWAPVGTTTWQTTGIFDNAGSRDSAPGSQYHAAAKVACMDCHGGSSPIGHETARLSTECQLCHYGGEGAGSGNQFRNIWAGGFGGGLTNQKTDTGNLEVHKSFVTTQDSISVFGGRYAPASNAACIACHTNVAVNISWVKPTTLVFTATEDTQGNYTQTGYAATGQVTITPTP
jgi:hypothetical protein